MVASTPLNPESKPEEGCPMQERTMNDLGANLREDGTVDFRVWAPRSSRVSVRILDGACPCTVELTAEEHGYFSGAIQGIGDGTRYLYRLDDGSERPDPASRYQPEGVHGPSQVVDPWSFPWQDRQWSGIPLESYVIYELHVGTFTLEGTFEAVIPRLDELVALGVTAVELMPVAQFPGKRNWGYDGVYPFAPQNSYGGPAGLKRLINACHRRKLAVILDVVYNHQGPEGNYSGCFGPYRTGRYRTPWGDAVNYDGPDSDPVRHFIVSNALYWLTEYHVDALRLDAIHGIFDFSARHILEELAMAVHRQARLLGRAAYLIAESDLNDVRVIKPRWMGGYNLDAQWCDDFHHSLHVLLTGEGNGYYQDFGRMEHLAKAIGNGFVYDGCYSAYRRRHHGSFAGRRPGRQFVICAQNHDQVGNRWGGERLVPLVSFEGLKLAAGVTLLSPAIPLLFMGEEYGDPSPFLYFIDHGDPVLIKEVQAGRQEEFRVAGQTGEPPDPAAPETFARSRLQWGLAGTGQHRVLLTLYRTLIALRRDTPVLAVPDRKNLAVRVLEAERLLFMERWNGDDRIFCLFSFSPDTAAFQFPAPGKWQKLLDSAESCWSGPGSLLPAMVAGGEEMTMNGHSLAIYRQEL